MNTIQDRWEEFKASKVAPGTPTLLEDEIKAVFYCGAEAVLGCEWEAFSDTKISPEGKRALLLGLYEETRDFFLSVVENKSKR